MTGVRLVWDTGSRDVPQASIRNDAGRYFLAPEVTRTGRMLPVGDRGMVPEPLVVEATVQEGTWAETKAATKALVADAKRAGYMGSVVSSRGTREMRHLQAAEVRTDGRACQVRLVFLPAEGVWT